MEIQNWILSGVVAILMVIVWFSVRNWVNRITDKFDTFSKKFDTLVKTLQKQSEQNIKQAGDINHLSKRADTSEARLNDHSKRINKLEIKTGND